ncbi:MAG: ribonuclease H [Candidatus Aquicultor secundus]|uniref:Ribonuclease H n=1 Tax=Candidatus Aquicultor secundus TaxID=1973895 RepID=A0A2M7T609_9ACTN|nr:ribonuclease HI family protein [Solirubrobacter sp.]PIU26488.1 MAG: ribonuclease H [Candidatus Aquicultor secundus]PIW21541.1 MAG: ribonuclease H [Candidatus Aquicultor secundus]PIX52638.1 MAG: ribonuclease H [Candidatus Aquicultor secundus]PIY39287.1 MAG: ribonuclease H [Candidatus Aquicultor secundus]
MSRKVIIYSDGAARGNPGPAGAGAQIKNVKGDVLAEVSEYLGETTNNVAEYRALILALEQAVHYKPFRIEIRADSELMVKQLNGEYKVKNMGLKPLYDRVKQLLAGCTSVEIKHIYRSENSAADELANKAIDEFENREEPQQQLPQKQPNDMPEQGNLF